MDTETQLTPPVKVGDIIENQEVINSGKKNDGVVKYQGYILFVQNCQKGDVVTFRVTKTLPKFGIAEVVSEE